MLQAFIIYLVIGAIVALFWRLTDLISIPNKYVHSLQEDFLIMLFYPFIILQDIFTNKNS